LARWRMRSNRETGAPGGRETDEATARPSRSGRYAPAPSPTGVVVLRLGTTGGADTSRSRWAVVFLVGRPRSTAKSIIASGRRMQITIRNAAPGESSDERPGGNLSTVRRLQTVYWINHVSESRSSRSTANRLSVHLSVGHPSPRRHREEWVLSSFTHEPANRLSVRRSQSRGALCHAVQREESA